MVHGCALWTNWKMLIICSCPHLIWKRLTLFNSILEKEPSIRITILVLWQRGVKSWNIFYYTILRDRRHIHVHAYVTGQCIYDNIKTANRPDMCHFNPLLLLWSIMILCYSVACLDDCDAIIDLDKQILQKAWNHTATHT